MKRRKMLFVFVILAFVSTFTSVVQADLLGRLRIEDVLKERLEQALKINDETAKVTVRIEYDKYESMGEDLPGMNNSAFNSFYAEKSEASDIKKITVRYFSETTEMAAEQSALIYSLIPTERKKISLTFKNLPKSLAKPIPVQAKDLTEIADKSVYMLSLMLGIALASAFLIFGFALFFNNSKNRTVFKQQFTNLISSLSNGMPGFGGAPSILQTTEATTSGNTRSIGGAPPERQIFAEYSVNSLAALFSDLYWCGKDDVAHYLWNNVTTSQKSELLSSLDFLYDYSIYFSGKLAKENEILFHPYYNKPLNLNKTSQENLLSMIKKNFSLWSLISPLRQQTLPLSLQEKIKANSATPLSLAQERFPESQPRSLPRPVTFGDISIEDELEIFKNSSIIPPPLRQHIPSLAWLALQDTAEIEQQFEKLDAKYLASAWVAAPEILGQLEQCLPEKKLLLLKSYLNSTTPSKSSAAFQFLFKLGLTMSSENYESIRKAS